MVLPLGQKMGLGLSHPYIYAQPYHQMQALVNIITNKTAKALNLLTKQITKMHNAINQNCLALDYLLSSEKGVYKKFNLSNCCLQIDRNKNH
jgi:hypothetical protein